MTNEELALCFQHGDSGAVGPLWTQMKGLAYSLAFRFYNRRAEACRAAGVEAADLQQESYFAVLDCAAAYDPEKGLKLTSYMKFQTLRRFNAVIHKRDNDAPRPLDGADSLNEPADPTDEGSAEIGDLIPDPAAEEAFEDSEHAAFIQQLHAAEETALTTCKPQTAEVIRARYFDGLTQVQAADRAGCSPQYVHCLEQQAIRKMRSGRGAAVLRSFVVDYGKAYTGTGFSVWENRGSVEERLIEKAESRINRITAG